MTNEAINQRPAVTCCCRNGARPFPNGDIYINAGCKIHGMIGPIDMSARLIHPSSDMVVQPGPVRLGGGGFHRPRVVN